MSSIFRTLTIVCSATMLCAVCALIFAQQTGGTQRDPQQNQLPRSVSEAPGQSDEMQLFMRAKLADSQKVMEGLVTEDFPMIAGGARHMKKISEAAHWPKTIDEIYQHHSVAFRRQCDKLVEQADRQDLQAAHYTYLHLTTTCIDCHNYVRSRFRVERQKKGGPIQLIPTQWDGPVEKRPKPPQPDDGSDADN